MADAEPYELHVTGPATRGLDRLTEGVAAAIVEFMVGALCDNPNRAGGPLLGEFAGQRSARRGAYRIIYRIDEHTRGVIVNRIEHRSTSYR